MDYINHILVGLGGTGGKVLRAFKMRLFEEYPDAEAREKLPIGLLYVDSTREMMGIGRPDFRVLGQDASFQENEFVGIKSVDIEKILDNVNSYPAIKGMIDNVSAVKSAIGSLGKDADQKRRAGRILFAANAIKYKNALDGVYARVSAISRTDTLLIHIFTGLAGGTGSGSIIDAITQARKAYRDAQIVVYAMVPELELPKPDIDKGRYYQNGYAALNEINALQVGKFKPCDVTSAGKVADFSSYDIDSVADSVILYSNVNENGISVHSFDELPQLVADYAYFRVFLDRKKSTEDFLRAYKFELSGIYSFEYEEKLAKRGESFYPQRDVVRSKKFSSFGIKRVIYPEHRILQHMTYTVGRRVLYQFLYNNWRENLGYVFEAENKDYKETYLKEEQQRKWLIDLSHLMLESKILPYEPKYEYFVDYWYDKAIGYAEEAKKASCPLNELDNIMDYFYAKSFRKNGVENFYKAKRDVINDLSKEVRQTIERDLFTWWKNGTISLYDLVKIVETLQDFIAKQGDAVNEQVVREEENFRTFDENRKCNVEGWTNLHWWERMVNKGARLYAEHQEILTDYYVTKTNLVALEFAKLLVARIAMELGDLASEISYLFAKISQAIEECDLQIASSQKENKGIEDMSGAVIEVSEEDRVKGFEKELMMSKTDQQAIADQMRAAIIPEGEYIPFATLKYRISIDSIKDAFDIRLSAIIKEKQEQMCKTDKLLDINLLQQLQQVLTTDEDIQRFALDLVKQSGVYLKFNDTEMSRYVPGNPNPAEYPGLINCKTILVTIPSPKENEDLKSFADKLATAFKDSFWNASQQTTLSIETNSARLDELSIASIVYRFPLRAVEWLSTYKERYDNLLHSPDEKANLDNTILLHSEGDGSQLPNLFVADAMKPEEYWPYLFIAAATGIIEKSEEGWGYSVTTKFGRKTTTTLSAEFINLITSDKLTEELREEFVARVEELLKGPDITEADKEAMEAKVIDIYDKDIVPRCKAHVAEFFNNYAEEAIRLIQK